MVIDVKSVIMLFTTGDQMWHMCIMRCSDFVCLVIVYSTTSNVSTLSSSKKYTFTQL